MSSLLEESKSLVDACLLKIEDLDGPAKDGAIRLLDTIIPREGNVPEITNDENLRANVETRVQTTINAELLQALPEEVSADLTRFKMGQIRQALDLLASLQRFVDDDIPYAQFPRVTGRKSASDLNDALVLDPALILSAVCEVARDRKASDILWNIGAPPRLKIDGNIFELDMRSLRPDDLTKIFLEHGRSPLQRDIFQAKGSLDTSIVIPGLDDVRFRASIYRELGEVGSVLRLIPINIPTPEELGLPLQIKELARHTQGIVLVTGRTGAGKSTTLASLIGLLNEEIGNKHIFTIEDPIEFIHRSKKSVIHHREVGSDTESFHSGIRDALREAPDVLLIGEIRDADTLRAALHASETGHLVFSTLHTNSAAETITRVLDLLTDPEEREQIRKSLSRSLLGVLSQNLIQRADGKGRVCAMEVMVCSPTIRGQIEKGEIKEIETRIDEDSYFKMQSMKKALLDLVRNGTITEKDALDTVPPSQLTALRHALRQ